MTVILVPESHRSYDNAVPQTDDGDLIAELVFLVLLALADAQDVGLMERVYLVTVQKLSVYKPQAKFKVFSVYAVRGQLAEQLPYQPSCYGAHPPVCLRHLLPAV